MWLWAGFLEPKNAIEVIGWDSDSWVCLDKILGKTGHSSTLWELGLEPKTVYITCGGGDAPGLALAKNVERPLVWDGALEIGFG
jgi:hypothetical protein